MAEIVLITIDDDDSFEEVESPWVPVATFQQMKREQEKTVVEEVPSQTQVDLPEIVEVEDDEDENGTTVIEELFPTGKSADLEEVIKKAKPEPLIGLEYVIEIQHNTLKKVPPNFSCLLCDFHVRKLSGSASNFDLIRGHLRTLAHKLKYLTRFFPTVRSVKFSTKAPVNVDVLNHVLEKICTKFGAMKVKVVVGHKLFKRKMPDIKKMIEDSTHFCEDQEVISTILNKIPSEPQLAADKATAITVKVASTAFKKSKTASSENKAKSKSASVPKSKIDEYEDAFTELEKDIARQKQNEHLKERWSQKTRPAEANSSKSSEGPLTNHSRELDVIPLEGANPGLSIPKVVSDQNEKGSKVGGKSKSREKSDKGKSSRSGRRQRRSSSGSDDRSRSRSGSRSRRRRSRSRSWSPLGDRRRERVLEYLEAVTVLERILEKKKLEQMDEPGKHPKYQASWNQFYKQKCREKGGKPVATGEITNEWIGVWKDLFFRFHEDEVKQEKNRLMNRHRLFYKDIEEFLKQDKGAANPRVEKPVASKSPPAKKKGTDSDTSVIGNLRILSALEMILDELGSDVVRCLGRANSLDANEGHGTSNEMIHDGDFFKLMGAARAKLLEKTTHPERLNANQLNAAKICIGNLTALMDKSRCHTLGEITLSAADIDLKARIVNIVATKFSQAGTDVSTAEFNRIVDYEFKRARQMTSSTFSSSTNVPEQSTGTTPSSINWGALENAVQTASAMPASGFSTAVAAQKLMPLETSSNRDYSSLSIDDLAVLFRNFQSLDQENQRKLVEHMRYLENTNPEKVLQLRKSLHGFLS